MNKFLKQQAGFSAVEALLILVILVIIGATGAYVLHVKNQSNAAFTAATKQPMPTSTAASAAAHTLHVPELHVQLVNIPDNLKDLVYAVNASQSDFAQVDFSAGSLATLDPKCAPDAGVSSIGLLVRGSGVYDSKMDTLAASKTLVKQFDGYYITYSHDDSFSCSTNPAAEKLHKQQAAAFKAYITKPANLQAL